MPQTQSNQLIRATTPKSAGFAQVFDTSGIARLQQQRKAKKEKKLQDLILDYDTKGVWKRDIPEVQRQVRAVQDFAMSNSEALSNPSQNIETWREWQDLQAKAKSTITYSIAAKEQFDRGMKAYMNGSNGMYLTENNKDVLYNYSETPTAEQYADQSAFDDPMKTFDRNLDLKMQDYADIANTQWKPTGIEDTGEDVSGKNVYKAGQVLNRDDVAGALEPRWKAQSLEGSSLKENYKGDFEAYVDDVMAMTEDPTKYGLTAPVAAGGVKAQTAAQRKAQYAVVTTGISGFSSVETAYDPETGEPYRYKDEQGKQQDAVRTYGMATTGGEGSVMRFQPDLRIVKNVTDAQDVTTGKLLEPGEGKKYKYQIPLERANYMVANRRIELHYTDKKGKKVKSIYEKGESLPDLEKMKKSGAITKNEYNKHLANAGVTSQDGYMVYASNENIAYFDLAEGEDVMNMLQGKGGRYLMVPAYTISTEVDQQLGYKHGTQQSDYRKQPAVADTNDYMEDI